MIEEKYSAGHFSHCKLPINGHLLHLIYAQPACMPGDPARCFFLPVALQIGVSTRTCRLRIIVLWHWKGEDRVG